jgi:hypothetical protein
MTLRPTTLRPTNLSDAPDPGQAYRRIWGDLGAQDAGDQTTSQDAQSNSDTTGTEPAPQIQLAGFSPLDAIARTGARAYFQADPQAKRNVRDNLRGVVGPGFSDGEMGWIADQFLNNAGATDIGVLQGVTAGAPQTITARQKATIDAIVTRLPNSPLNQRAITAYRRALANGNLRIR